MKQIFKKVYNFFDKLEDKVRGHLSKYSLTYGIIGGIAIVLFWRGVWHLADQLGLPALASFLIGLIALLMTGLLTASFIGDHIIISGLRQEKKVVDMEQGEIKTERDILKEVRREVERIEKEVLDLEKEVHGMQKK